MSSFLSKNRGEWSELYVVTSLLAHDFLTYSLNDGEQKTSQILEISRGNGRSRRKYVIEGDRVRIDPFGTYVSKEWLVTKSTELLAAIKSGVGRSFPIPEVNDLLEGLKTHQISAESKMGDISIRTFGLDDGETLENRFNIKSRLGGKPTLLNSSRATRITYRLSETLTESEQKDLNRLGPALLVETVKSLGMTLTFAEMDPRFVANLMTVDTQMPEILAEMVLISYSGGPKDLQSVVSKVALDNHLKFDGANIEFSYSHKATMMLQQIGLGMVPSKTWKGRQGASGGLITVLPDGELKCSLEISQESLGAELFVATRFDTPSRIRLDYGRIYEKNGISYLDLNFQIRYR